MKLKIITGTIISTLSILLMPFAAFAHVVVTPSKVGIGEEQIFSISVPNERESAITEVKLIIPSSATDISPTIKEGWTITTQKSGTEVSEIVWSNGSIPPGERTDFSFSAQAPAKKGMLDWKAYQTYADGTVVHWDQTPNGSDDSDGDAGPYSMTYVVDDFVAPTTTTNVESPNNTLGLVVSIVALVLSIFSVFIRTKKNRK